MALLGVIGGIGSAIAKAIQNNSKSSGTNKGSGGNTGSSSNTSSNTSGTDYSSIIYSPTASYEEKLAAYNARYAKEQQMRNAGTWDNNWVPTEQLGGILNNMIQPQSLNPNENAYQGYADMIQANNDQTRALYQSMVQQGTDRLNAQRGDVNTMYDNAAQQAYISYMQGQKTMPGQMAALGMTGGASESSLMQSQAGYQNNLNSVNTARGKALNDINTAITDLRNSGDVQTAQAILSNADKSAEAYWNALQADINRRDSLSQQAQQNAYNNALLTGSYNGNPTLDAQQNAYGQWQDAYARALQTAKLTGNYSTMKQFGWTDEQVRAANAQFTTGGSTGGTGGSSRGGASSYAAAPVDYGDDEPEGTNPAPALQSVYNKVRDTALALFSAGTPSAQVAAYLDSFEGQLSDDEKWQIMQQLNLYGARGG